MAQFSLWATAAWEDVGNVVLTDAPDIEKESIVSDWVKGHDTGRVLDRICGFTYALFTST